MRLEVGNVHTFIYPEDSRDFKFIEKQKKVLTVEIPGAKHTWKYKSTSWDGKVCLLKDEDLQIPTGYAPTFISNMREFGVQPTIEDKRIINSEIKTLDTTVPLRDYQWDASNNFLSNKTDDFAWWPRGVLRLGTGAGKTVIAAALTQIANVPTTFLVTQKTLMYQAAERFKEYGIKTGLLGDGVFDLEADGVNIVMVQTLHSRLNKKPNVSKGKKPTRMDEAFLILSLLARTEFLIIDEAHGIASSEEKGNQLTEVLDQFENAYMRLGLTATPFMRERFDNFLLEGYTGQVLYDLPARALIDMGILQEGRVRFVKIPPLRKEQLGWQFNDNGAAKYRKVYERAIVLNDYRNKTIVNEALALDGPTIILVTRTQHGDILKAEFAARGHEVTFLRGDHKEFERQDAVKELIKSGGTLIASGIFNTGVDIPELQNIIIAGGGKSEVTSSQQRGRALRKSKDKKDVQFVDFNDRSPMLSNHSAERLRSWIEQGFEVTEVESN